MLRQLPAREGDHGVHIFDQVFPGPKRRILLRTESLAVRLVGYHPAQRVLVSLHLVFYPVHPRDRLIGMVTVEAPVRYFVHLDRARYDVVNAAGVRGILQGQIGLHPPDVEKEMFAEDLDLVELDQVVELGSGIFDADDDVSLHQGEEEGVETQSYDDLFLHYLLVYRYVTRSRSILLAYVRTFS